MADQPDVRYMSTKNALIDIVRLSVAQGNDDEFVAWAEATAGFAVYTQQAMWRVVAQLVTIAANCELYEDPEGPDHVAFTRVLEDLGHTEARRWLMKRMLFGRSVAVTPDRPSDGAMTTAIYLPVDSKLESLRRRRSPRRINSDRPPSVSFVEGVQ